MPISPIFMRPITDQECTHIFASLSVGDNGLSDVLLAFCWHITSVFHVALIMLSVLLACWGVSGHISGPRRPFPVKIIQIITLQICLNKLRIADVESLISAQRRCSRHRELPVTGDLIGEGVTTGMSEAFVKELNVLVAEWDPEPCCWLRRGCVPKL